MLDGYLFSNPLFRVYVCFFKECIRIFLSFLVMSLVSASSKSKSSKYYSFYWATLSLRPIHSSAVTKQQQKGLHAIDEYQFTEFERQNILVFKIFGDALQIIFDCLSIFGVLFGIVNFAQKLQTLHFKQRYYYYYGWANLQYSQKSNNMEEPIPFSDRLKMKGFTLGEQILIECKGAAIICQLQHSQLSKIPAKLYAQSVDLTNNSLKFYGFVPQTDINQSSSSFTKDYPISIGDGKTKVDYQLFLHKYYKCIYSQSEKIIKLYIKQDRNMSLCFQHIERPRFAKTVKLEKILSGEDSQQHGILTMDQSGRFLIQKSDCKFPAIGIWYKCDSLHQILVYAKICSFLKRKPSKAFNKFIIGVGNQNYIAFAKISRDQMPQLYFVSWKIDGSQNEIQFLSQYHIKSQKQIVIQFSKQNLQFTLRGETNSKIGGFSSPKKFMTNQQLQDQLQRIHLQQSPQFSSIKKHNQWPIWQQQKAQLTHKIESQQQQIERLNGQVKKLTKQLNNLRKCLTSPPQKPLANFKSPLLIPDSSTPAQKSKKLSQSDLQQSNLKSFASGSTKQKKSTQNQSIQDSNSFQTKKNPISYDQDPWDMMQIIE